MSLLDELRSRGYSPGFMAICEIYGEVGEIVNELQKEIARLRAELEQERVMYAKALEGETLLRLDIINDNERLRAGLAKAHERMRVMQEHSRYSRLAASRRDAKEIARLQRRANFFASVIKSGEAWSGTCEQEYRAALATSSGLTGGPPEKEDR